MPADLLVAPAGRESASEPSEGPSGGGGLCSVLAVQPSEPRLSLSVRATTTEVLIVDNTPPERRSTVLGTYYLVNQPVGGVAAPVFGVVAGAIGIGAAYSWLAVIFLVLSAIALIAAWPTGRALRGVPSSPD